MSGKTFGGLKIQAGKKNKLSSSKAAPTEQRRSIFGDDDLLENASDEDLDDEKQTTKDSARKFQPPSRGSSNSSRAAVNTELIAHAMHNQQLTKSVEEEVDPSIYAYDDVYDTMKSAERSARAQLVGDGESQKKDGRKSKYIDTLQESLKMRTQDRLLARDKLNKREREEEGDEFAAAPVFESAAFKRQKAELEKTRAEEEEKERKEKERKSRGGGAGLVGVYQKILKQSEGSHEAQVRAAAAAASAKAVKDEDTRRK
ncbi:coiled-coil domain-containing protein 55-domain containing protein [Myxozyma melibiosi]|uniref:Coiled-coil domain-containing protein 55-domain containing protein n=1 Tax=Myxozyma melibiosi TaxID=54550 RepID=A0ABR1F380_9ASCO